MTRLQAKFATGSQPVLSLAMRHKPADADRVIAEATAHAPGANRAVNAVAARVIREATVRLVARGTRNALDLAAHLRQKPAKPFQRGRNSPTHTAGTTTDVALVASDGVAAERTEYGSGRASGSHYLGGAARAATNGDTVTFKPRGRG